MEISASLPAKTSQTTYLHCSIFTRKWREAPLILMKELTELGSLASIGFEHSSWHTPAAQPAGNSNAVMM